LDAVLRERREIDKINQEMSEQIVKLRAESLSYKYTP
jgi:hypothetical protein